ncbi:MAG TPA: S-adenosylmethionine:tRNA ribosyltransferase-isomerase, partial [Exilispira sp.]|nr:S-adenosylmethionine:tRNA ribosyltransferase-isomerase [Exilispira sp.]
MDKNKDIFSLSSYDFKIDESRIRKYPRANREDAKLLVVDKSGNIKFDGIFKDIANFLNENSILVLNNTRVIKSRILAKRLKTNKEIEILIIEKINSSSFLGLVKNQKSFKISEKLEVLNRQWNFQVANESYPKEGYGEDKQQSLVLTVVDKNEEGIVINFGFDANLDFVDSLGKIPIPPYLR